MIYLDMDGVIADFRQHLLDLNIPDNRQWHEPRSTWTEETWAGEKQKIDAMHSPGFWETIPEMPEARSLWDFCDQFGHFVLTAKPMEDSPGVVADGKFQWLNQHFGEFPRSRFICCPRSQKQKFIGSNPHKHQILIDDDIRNIAAWQESGGIGIHHKYSSQSIKEVKEIVNAAQ